MLYALNLTKFIEFESPRDPAKGTAEATKFKLGAIPSRIYTMLKDRAATFKADPNDQSDVLVFHGNTAARDYVKYGLKGFENYGNLEFKTVQERIAGKNYDVVADDVLEAIDVETIRELSDQVKQLSDLDGEAVKNLEG